MPKYRARLPASLHLIVCRSRFPIRSQAARWHFLATCSRTTTAPAFLQFAYTHSLALHSPCFLFIVSRSAREFRKRWMLHGSRARTLQNIVFESALFFVLPFVRREMKKWSAPPRHTGETKSAQRGRKSIFYGRTAPDTREFGETGSAGLEKVLENSDSGNKGKILIWHFLVFSK